MRDYYFEYQTISTAGLTPIQIDSLRAKQRIAPDAETPPTLKAGRGKGKSKKSIGKKLKDSSGDDASVDESSEDDIGKPLRLYTKQGYEVVYVRLYVI